MANHNAWHYAVVAEHLLDKEPVRFLIVGGTCTIVDFALFFLLHIYGGIDLIISNMLSYGTGLTLAFLLNRAWTFTSAGKQHIGRIYLSLFYGYLGLALNTAIVWLCADHMPPMLAKTVAVLIVLVYNYLTNKYLVFAAR